MLLWLPDCGTAVDGEGRAWGLMPGNACQNVPIIIIDCPIVIHKQKQVYRLSSLL